jgi:hypothetical protein
MAFTLFQLPRLRNMLATWSSTVPVSLRTVLFLADRYCGAAARPVHYGSCPLITAEFDAAGAKITYSDLKGNPYTQPIWTIVLQVVNHSSHHRGQAVGFIRALGHTPPNVDLITFSRQRI